MSAPNMDMDEPRIFARVLELLKATFSILQTNTPSTRLRIKKEQVTTWKTNNNNNDDDESYDDSS